MFYALHYFNGGMSVLNQIPTSKRNTYLYISGLINLFTRGLQFVNCFANLLKNAERLLASLLKGDNLYYNMQTTFEFWHSARKFWSNFGHKYLSQYTAGNYLLDSKKMKFEYSDGRNVAKN